MMVRVGGLESQMRQLPTIWQVVGAITAINALTTALAFGVVELIHALP